MLLCNPGNTEVIQFTSRFVRNPVLSQFSFGNTIIELSDKVRGLGVILDKELNLRTFALIVSALPYCARKFACHVIHERARLVIK